MLLKKCLSPLNLISLHRNIQTCSVLQMSKRWTEKTEVPFKSEFKNPVAEVYGGAEAWPDEMVRYF